MSTPNNEQANEHLRMVEALLFAAGEPLSVAQIAERLPDGADVQGHIETIRRFYSGRGVNLVELAGKWMFRTAPDLSFLLRKEVEEQRKLSRAGVETLAIIAYHQPVTRAEIEEIRGVGLSKGTLDVLMEAGWIRPKGRRRTPGRPVTYGTSEEFLVHFGLESVEDLPGLEELKAAGLLDSVDKALSKMEQEMARQREADEAQTDLEDAIDKVSNPDPDLEPGDDDLQGRSDGFEDVDDDDEEGEEDIVSDAEPDAEPDAEVAEDDAAQDDEEDDQGEDATSADAPTLALVKDSIQNLVGDDEDEGDEDQSEPSSDRGAD